MKYRQNAEFMKRAAQEMLDRGLSNFMPQAISNACWAFAKHDLVYDEFLQVSSQHKHVFQLYLHFATAVNLDRKMFSDPDSLLWIYYLRHCLHFTQRSWHVFTYQV